MSTYKMYPLLLGLAVALGACDPEADQAKECDVDTEFRLHNWGGPPEVVASFTQHADHPEGIGIDRHNNIFISMALSGEIRKIASNGTQSTLAWLDLGPPGECPPGGLPGIMGALAVDFWSNVFVGTAACSLENSGLWKIAPNGTTTKIASLPPGSFPNGIAERNGHVYVSDSFTPRLYRAPTTGNGELAEVFLESELLQVVPQPILTPGANGVQFYLNEVYVANSSQATIVAVPLIPSGGAGGLLKPSAGTPYVKYGPEGSGAQHQYSGDPMPGCDDFALDVIGNIYCTTDPFQTVVHISRTGHVTTLLTAADGLDGPTAAAFGKKNDLFSVYVTNASFPFFESTGHGPSLIKIQGHLPGYPLR